MIENLKNRVVFVVQEQSSMSIAKLVIDGDGLLVVGMENADIY